MMAEEQKQSPMDEVNVFVKYLPSSMNDAGLRQLFASCGKVVSAKVMVDGHKGSSLGYGFVRFSTQQEAQDAVTKMSGLRIANKALLCKLSEPSIYPELGDNLYIKPLPLDFDEEQLVELFKPFGTIVTAKIMRDKQTGESKQIGFVKFEDQSCATEALEKMNGSKLEHNLPSLIVKYAESDLKRVTRQARTNPKQRSPSPPASPPSTPLAAFPPCGPYLVPSLSYEYSPMAYGFYPAVYNVPYPVLRPMFHPY